MSMKNVVAGFDAASPCRSIDRFLAQQVIDYPHALAEIKAGHKSTHWIWYVFPQLKGLGFSQMSEYYGLADLAEAREYLAHPILGANLREITAALLAHRGKSATDILGYPDDLKVKSCMTLFDVVEPNSIFAEVLAAFYDAIRDERTIDLIK